MRPLPDCFTYTPNFVGMDVTDLANSLTWERRTVRMYGRDIPLPRDTAWYGEAAYRYSGIVNQPQPWTPLLLGMRDYLKARNGIEFNSCLANYYRDGNDSVSWHADDEPELGKEPVIASVSIGAKRAFKIKEKGGFVWELMLGGGDLLIMQGPSQRDYLHCVPKTKKPVGPRINLTFRFVGGM